MTPPIGMLERRCGDLARAAADRLRAAWWRMRGAQLAAKVRVGAGCAVERPWCLAGGHRLQIERGVHIKIVDDAARLAIGAGTFIGFGSELDVAQEVRIGKGVLIAPHCFITDHEHRHEAGKPIDSQGQDSRPVVLGDDVWLGAHAVILPGVTVGDGAIVGAGAVVTRDVAAGSIVAGVPARPIGHRK